MYTCQNKTCAIAINKAEFPAMMNCPVCQEPMKLVEKMKEELLSVEDEQLLKSLPYVIAYPLQQALLEKNAIQRVNYFSYAFSNYLKYLGLLTASEFFNSPFKERKIVDLFQQNLAQPSLGKWRDFTRDCLLYLKNQNHHFFCSELAAYHEAVETGKKRKLYNGEIEVLDSFTGDVTYAKQQVTATSMLIYFRNRYLGHGTPLSITISEKLWNEYFPVFRLLLEQLTFCEKFPMLKQEASLFYTLQGVEIIPFDVKEKPLPKVSIYNINTGKSMPVIPFFIIPGELAIDREDKSNIFSYESNTGVRITFFSPEGDVKDASGKLLDKLQFLLRDKQKETPYSPDAFTKELFLERIADENKIALQTLIAEKKVIEGIYQHREEMEIKLREWIGARANIFFIAAEAGSGKTNLLVEMQKQYAERNLASLFIRASRMEKTSLKEELAYQLNLDPSLDLSHYTFLAGTQAEPTFILIDGLNETHHEETIWQEILEISAMFEPGSLKFVITSRTNSKSDLGRYAISEKQLQYLYGENKDHEATLAAFSFWLTPLDMKEMEGAWNSYVARDKKRFKPLFSFNDIATFDRGLYLQLNNPLVLRIFLETYNGKKLPKKGIKHLHVWKDWIATFTDEEQKFMRLLADAVWEKGENELLLDDVSRNQNLQPYILTDNISAPYQRLLTMGWISGYYKDFTVYVNFTVEGVLLYLLGTKLNRQNPGLTSDTIGEILNTGTKLQKSAIESFLCEQALEGKMDLITQLIDEGDEKLEICVTPLLYFLKSQGVERTIEILLKNPSDNDWYFLYDLENKLDATQLQMLRAELLKKVMSFNPMQTENEIMLGLKAMKIADDDEYLMYNSKLNINSTVLLNNVFILSNLGEMENARGNYNQAFWYLQRSLSNVKKEDKSNRHDSLIYSDIAMALKYKGEFDSALEYLQKSLEILLKIYGENHPDVAICYNNIGLLFIDKGDLNSSLEFYKKSLDIGLRTRGEFHADIATTYNNIGAYWLYLEDYEKALEFSQKSVSIYIKIYGSHHPDIARGYNNIGAIFMNKNEFQTALKYYEKSLTIRLKIYGEEHPDIARNYSNIGSVFFEIGQLNIALEYFQKSLRIRINSLGIEHLEVAMCYKKIALVYAERKELNTAMDYYKKYQEIYINTFGREHLDVVTSYFDIGNLLFENEKYEKAITSFQKGYVVSEKGGFPFGIAKCHEALHQKEKALDFFIQSLVIRKDDLGLEDEVTQETLTNVKRLVKELGKEKEEFPEWIKEIL